MKSAELEYDFTGLHNFVRLMDSANRYVVKVGIFGNKSPREAAKGKQQTLTNAELGLIHELGSIARHIPPRSFLRMPISIRSKEIIQKGLIGAPELLKAGNIRKILGNLGKACEIAIQQAFATGGFGNWKDIKLATKKRKDSDSILIDTAQLRRSIASKVDER